MFSYGALPKQNPLTIIEFFARDTFLVLLKWGDISHEVNFYVEL